MDQRDKQTQEWLLLASTRDGVAVVDSGSRRLLQMAVQRPLPPAGGFCRVTTSRYTFFNQQNRRDIAGTDSCATGLTALAVFDNTPTSAIKGLEFRPNRAQAAVPNVAQEQHFR